MLGLLEIIHARSEATDAAEASSLGISVYELRCRRLARRRPVLVPDDQIVVGHKPSACIKSRVSA